MLELRDNTALVERKHAAEVITDKLLHAEWYAECEKLLVYSAIRSEVDLAPFIEQAWADGKQLYFPKVEGEEMEFYLANGWEELAPGAFGVREPVSGIRLERMIPFLTPVLVPGAAFSKNRQRIGYGKGYYDKYLLANQKNKRLAAIGIAYSFQITDEFETGEFDYPMQEIVSNI
jgi:5-formyltetrahydrofolate cyclo-ligase